MPIEWKWTLSLFIVGVSIAFALIDPKANNAGPAWFWPRRSAPRFLLMNADGSLKSHVKPSALLWFAFLLAAIWWYLPTTT